MTKHYIRLKSEHLPKPRKISLPLGEAIISRVSFRDFSREPIKRAELSDVLYYGSGLTHKLLQNNKPASRSYPSAGAKYPLEIYPLVRFGSNMAPGLYHYQPENHSLDLLLVPADAGLVEGIWFSQPWFKDAAVILIITSAYQRTTEKYGDIGISFSYIEAGHIAQNVYLTATAVGIGCCAIGQMREKAVISLLDINPNQEYPIYYIAVGN